MSRVIAVLVCFAALLPAFTATAGWNGTYWGMKKEAFEAKLGKPLILMEESSYMAEGYTQFYGYDFSTIVEFAHDGLAKVTFMQTGPESALTCRKIVPQLRDKHTLVKSYKFNEDGFAFIVNDGDTDIVTVVQIPDSGDHRCAIQFMPKNSMFKR